MVQEEKDCRNGSDDLVPLPLTDSPFDPPEVIAWTPTFAFLFPILVLCMSRYIFQPGDSSDGLV